MIYLYPIISGIILLISFNCSGFWFLSFFALVPLFYFLYQENLSPKKVFLWGYIFGLIFISGTISWFWSAYPLDWLGIESKVFSILLIFLIWFASSLVLSLFLALWVVLFHKLKRKNLIDVFLAPSLWVLFEYLRSIGLSIFWLGPESLIGPHWSLGFLGYVLAENNLLLQFANIGGIYLLSLVVVFVNIFLYWIINSSAQRRTVCLGSFIVLAVVSLFTLNNIRHRMSNNNNDGYLKVAVLHTNFPSFFKISKKDFFNRLIIMKDLLYKIKKDNQNPDLVIFPEDSRFLSSLKDKGKGEFLKEILGEEEKLIIDSSRTKENKDGIKSKISYFNTKTKITQYYNKVFLLPNGEYLPFIVSFAGKFLGQRKWVDDFNNFRGYTRGDRVLVGEFNGVKIGTLFCSEIISPQLYKFLVNEGSQVLINITSQSAFHGSQLLYKQTLNMAKVRAVENNRYFIFAGNFTPSFIINNKGQIVKISGQEEDIIYGDIKLIDN